MRIISGKYKGMKLNLKIPPGVRPTTDSMKESIFNILANRLEIEGSVVLDLFSGSGSLGFEVISRGAELCIFVEKNRKSCSHIKKIAKYLDIPEDNYEIINKDAVRFLNSIDDHFPNLKADLVFCDPFYEQKVANKILTALDKSDCVQKGGIFIIEHEFSEKLIPTEGWEIVTTRNYGESEVDFVERNA